MEIKYMMLITIFLIIIGLGVALGFGINSTNKNHAQNCKDTCTYFNLPYYNWDYEDSLFCYCIKDGLPHKILAKDN